MIELWNVSRSLGLVALLLLSVVLALGVLHHTSLGQATGQVLPRFVLVALHRNLALITVVFVALHVVTVLVTPYLPLRWFDVLVPGTALYNPLPAALGAAAFDLLLAVVISSGLRRRLGKRAWLVVHWGSYVCFPVAVAHAAANASFRGGTWWTLVVPLLSTAVVVGALLARRAARRRAREAANGTLAPRGAANGTLAPREAANGTLAPREAFAAREAQPARRRLVHELRVVAGPGERSRTAGGSGDRASTRARHAADPLADDVDDGADARIDTVDDPGAPTVALPTRPRR